MDNLITTVVKKAIKKDLYFAIDCEQGYRFWDKEFYQHPTQDITKLCEASNNNIKYTGVDNLDSCYIFFFTKLQANHINSIVGKETSSNYSGGYPENYEEIKHSGWIRWDNWNEGIEKISDYTIKLDELIGLESICDEWDKKIELLMG